RFNSAGWAALAGVAAGLCAWTKNEGLLWLAAFVCARILVARGRFLPAFLFGALPALGMIVMLKTHTSTPNYILSSESRAGLLTRFQDISRYGLIFRAALKHAWRFGPLAVSPFAILTAYLAVMRIREKNPDRGILASGALAVLLTASGFFMI